jgi:3'-phosphoadenosine 5'-phosphosulfate sulfotransferase (PAPS reductase)/FAD synthetase
MLTTPLAGGNAALELAAKGAWFIASHSGGKDSQAQYIALLQLGIPEDQIIVCHADLGEVEHRGSRDHIDATVRPSHRDLLIADAIHADGSTKDFFSAVRARRATLDRTDRYDKSAAPDGQNRYCTSDLKTAPIWKAVKGHLKARGVHHGIIVNCVGIRALEGGPKGRRAKMVAARPLSQFKVATKPNNNTWTCYDWWPLAYWTEAQVWEQIHAVGQRPHPNYGYDHGLGRATRNQRISCEFCVFGSPNDLRLAAARRPELLAKLVQLEEDIRGPLHISRIALKEIIA